MSERRGGGCCAQGCLILFVVGLIFAGLTAWGCKRLYDLCYAHTSPSLMPVEQVQIGDVEYAVLRERAGAFLGALEAGAPAALSLGEIDLNALIRRDPGARQWRDHVSVRIRDSNMIVEASVPLSGIPFFDGRFLDMRVHMSPSIRDGELRVNLSRVEMGRGELPREILGDLETAFLGRLLADPDTARLREIIRKFRSFRVESGRVQMESGRSASGASREA